MNASYNYSCRIAPNALHSAVYCTLDLKQYYIFLSENERCKYSPLAL